MNSEAQILKLPTLSRKEHLHRLNGLLIESPSPWTDRILFQKIMATATGSCGITTKTLAAEVVKRMGSGPYTGSLKKLFVEVLKNIVASALENEKPVDH